MQHEWITKHEDMPDVYDDDDLGNEVSHFARHAEDPHNGPQCKLCGFNFCVHCHPKGWKDNNCLATREALPDGPAARTLEEAVAGIFMA